MKVIRRFLLLVLIIISMFLSVAHAKEVSLKYKNITLNGNLELAEDKKLQDGIVLILHGFLAHNRMELMEASQLALLENERSSLAINLSYGIDNRHGFYDCMIPIRHKLADAMDELDAWIAWLEAQGVKNIVLMGHSMSANQVLVYASANKNPVISRLVLLAPNTVGRPNSAERYREKYGNDLTQFVERAKLLIDEGKGKELMEQTDYGFCPKATVTAEAFYDFYQQGNEFWQSYQYLPLVDAPVMVIGASEDERQPNLMKFIKPQVDNEKIFLTVIEGAGHFFRDLNIDEAVEAAVEFIGD